MKQRRSFDAGFTDDRIEELMAPFRKRELILRAEMERVVGALVELEGEPTGIQRSYEDVETRQSDQRRP
ncbi:MAG: hypothetical protein U0136_20885 [Bdellovibrionota bacterium]